MFVMLLAVLCLVVMSIWTLLQVQRDYREKEGLRPETVASVLGVYTLHFAIELLAAWARLWPYQTYTTESVILGVILAVVGLALFVLGTIHLGDLNNMTGMETGQLVTGGIYRWSRHPQNLGGALFLLGVALVSRSWMALLLAVVFWGMLFSYVPMEEAYLESIFGDEYRRYKEKTWRYLGPPKNNHA